MLGCALALLGSACGTVDLGDNFIAPDLVLDEDFFFCRVQPEVISASTCASGGAGESGSCHSARSSLRLDPAAEGVAPPPCDAEGVLLADPPAEYERNLEALRFTVQSDPLSSPVYRRPLGLDSHPRVIFDEASPQADLLVQWILMGGT